ncbi:exonuclease domain-containing protein [Nocardia sp. NPDC056064]|uniref:exonuclease domain-containing protein n=1 Tax=Nocardia sp. NPDC056064 TaxID=3345701 RepID=UPI0035DB9A70
MTENLSFAAFDVETANPKHGSICAIGVAIVHKGRRVATHSWLCRPPAVVGEFAARNMRIHMITPNLVAKQPSFAQLLPRVLDTVGDLPVVAHNAVFDMGNLSRACEFSGIVSPGWQYGCTYAWSKRQLRLGSYKLNQVAAALGIVLDNHHEAGADAAAAADVAISLARMAGAHDLADLARINGTRLARLGGVRR